MLSNLLSPTMTNHGLPVNIPIRSQAIVSQRGGARSSTSSRRGAKNCTRRNYKSLHSTLCMRARKKFLNFAQLAPCRGRVVKLRMRLQNNRYLLHLAIESLSLTLPNLGHPPYSSLHDCITHTPLLSTCNPSRILDPIPWSCAPARCALASTTRNKPNT